AGQGTTFTIRIPRVVTQVPDTGMPTAEW
ncbi:MAG: hypothetical protein RLY86_4347, partial [Pseudomonadota bacterium]